MHTQLVPQYFASGRSPYDLYLLSVLNASAGPSGLNRLFACRHLPYYHEYKYDNAHYISHR